MRCITLTQPWATLIAVGAKRFETRSWRTDYRGPLAIHAAKGLSGMSNSEFARIIAQGEFLRALHSAGYGLISDLPFGAIIAVVELVDCVPTEQVQVSDRERGFGDFSPNRYAWKLENVRPLARPISTPGRLGLWEFDDALIAAALERGGNA